MKLFSIQQPVSELEQEWGDLLHDILEGAPEPESSPPAAAAVQQFAADVDPGGELIILRRQRLAREAAGPDPGQSPRPANRLANRHSSTWLPTLRVR
jgi:hypothetical protein